MARIYKQPLKPKCFGFKHFKELDDYEKTILIDKTIVMEHIYRNKFGHHYQQGEILTELALHSGARFVDLFLLASDRKNDIAYEVKASRTDFLKDIKDPEKQKLARKYSKYHYYVCLAGMIEADEIPAGSGLVYIEISECNEYHQFNIIKHCKPNKQAERIGCVMDGIRASKRTDEFINRQFHSGQEKE